MLNSIITGNVVNKLNIDRVTNKNTGSSYRMYFLTICIISLLLTTFSNNNDFEKYSKLLNNFLIKNGFTINNIQISGINNISKETIIKIVNSEKKSNAFFRRRRIASSTPGSLQGLPEIVEPFFPERSF